MNVTPTLNRAFPLAAAGRPARQEVVASDSVAPGIDIGTATRILNQSQGADASLAKLWDSNVGEEVRGLAVAPDGRLLVNLTNGYRILSAADGKAGPKVEHELLQSPPMLNANGSSYLVGSWGVARVEADGKQSWQKYLGSSVFRPAIPTVDGGVVAIPCSGGEVHRLDSQGQPRWICEVEPKPCYGFSFEGHMVQDGLGRILFAANGKLYGVDLEKGEKTLEQQVEPEGIYYASTPAVTPDNHIAVSTSSTLQLLKPDGSSAWIWSGHSDRRIDQLPPESWTKDHLEPTMAPMSCPPAVSPDGSAIYGGGCLNDSKTHNLVALDREGELLWRRNLNPHLRVEQILVGSDKTIYAVGTSHEYTPNQSKQFTEAYALSPEGEVLWSFRTPQEGHFYNRVALDRNTLYLTAAGGTVYALRADALREQCEQSAAGAQIDLGGGNFVIVGGVAVKKRRPG